MTGRRVLSTATAAAGGVLLMGAGPMAAPVLAAPATGEVQIIQASPEPT